MEVKVGDSLDGLNLPIRTTNKDAMPYLVGTSLIVSVASLLISVLVWLSM